MSHYSEAELVAILQKASDAYYNGKEDGLLGDEQYDALRDELEERFPSNPFLKQIGAPVEKGAVQLPFKMASLNKIKPGSGAVESFQASSGVKQWVLSDKLDGISVLWQPKKKKLYLRGDGFLGVDISAFAPYLSGLMPRGFKEAWTLRGELVVRKDIPVDGDLSRSWVNGQLHQKTPIPEQLGKIRFVAYELVEPATLTRAEQMKRMAEAGFEVPLHCVLGTLNDDALSAYLRERREKSVYPIDGIVVGENRIPLKDTSSEVSNPKDMRAFKMPMDDQRATTTVVDVVWSASHQGYWIPRIQIQPVQIGGSRIEFLTGHNARVIVQNKISKGAVIVVRKSGDVIPTLERVVSEGSEPILPEGVWDGDAASAAHYKVKMGSTTLEIQSKKLEHFASTLGIPHLGPGLVAKLVSDGKDTPRLLLTCSKEEMEKSLGKGMAAKIFPQIQERLTAATELDLMIASSLMPRGVGSTKLKALFQVESDPRHWNEVFVCEGWSEGALKEFLKSFPQYEEWRRTQLSMIPYPKLFTPPPKPQQTGVLYRICMTGFRDKELQAQLEAKGHEFVQAISSKVSLLLVKDPSETSEKLKKARELGIRILSREQAKLELL